MPFTPKEITYKVPDTDVLIRFSQDAEGNVDIEVKGDNGTFDFSLYKTHDSRTIEALGFPTEETQITTTHKGDLEKVE